MEKPRINSTSSFNGVPMERNLFFCVGSIAQITGVHRFSHLFFSVSRKKHRRAFLSAQLRGLLEESQFQVACDTVHPLVVQLPSEVETHGKALACVRQSNRALARIHPRLYLDAAAGLEMPID